ncbi:hypothetical protein MTO96_025600 [Rhipicephalus appendiculatus]
MRPLEYDYTISHTPGNQLFTADLLSRKPQQNAAAKGADRDIESAVEELEALTLEQLPASEHMLERIKLSVQADTTLSTVATLCTSAWPSVHGLAPELKHYAEVASELSLVEGLLFKGDRLVIPPILRLEVLERLHEGHMGRTRCRARARQSAWWPGIGKDIEEYVQRCQVCQKHRKPATEPLLQTPLPAYPRDTIGIDLFSLEGKEYIVVVDYYSRLFELEQLRGTATKDVVSVLEQIIARFGVPRTIRMDNGPQFASWEFRQLMKRWGTNHITSSPYYAQSNWHG